MESATSYKTKLLRKEKRYAGILLADTDIHTAVISRFVMICNAGLLTGYTEEKVFQLVSQYSGFVNITMIPGKSYCFVEFENELHSQHVVKSLHGKSSPQHNSPLYLLFVDKIPELYNPFNNNYKPEGLIVIDNFLNEDEENKLIGLAENSDTYKQSENTLKFRRVEHFGYKFRYDNNSVDKEEPMSMKIPKDCDFVIKRFKHLTEATIVKDWTPNQLTINHYEPGQGIPPHVDSHDSFDGIILSLSLGSDIIMEFRHHDGTYIPLLLHRRSLLIMSGETRLIWNHGISSRKQDVVPGNCGLTVQQRGKRISYTFRRIRIGPCNCAYTNSCDSKSRSKSLENFSAIQLEALHVHSVYDKIAEHFSETRHKPWPNILSFVNSLTPGSIFIDVGCGNGRFFGINPLIVEIGCDRSFGLCSICSAKGNQVLVCDCLQLPYRSNCADACTCIAVIHHLSTFDRRLKALQEIARILKVGGQALVYVWAKEQKKNNVPSSYLKQNREYKRKKININCTDKNQESVLQPSVKSNKNKEPHEFEKLEKECRELEEQFHNMECCLPHLTDKNCKSASQKIHDDESRNEKINVLKFVQTDRPPVGEDYDKSKNVFPIHVNRTEFHNSDVFVEWKVKPCNKSNPYIETPKYFRYYHVFSENELEYLSHSIENIKVLKNYYDQGNWCMLFEKI